MKYIELRQCTPTKQITKTILVNKQSIIRVDNTNPTTVYITGIEREITVIEAYNYIKYEITEKL